MVSIYEVASKFTVLRSRGNGQYYGLCPFHDEDTPSFHINENLNVFYCFGCRRGGNVYQFISYIENVPIEEVDLVLAEKYGYKELLKNKRYKKEVNAIDVFYDLLKKHSDDEFAKKYNFERLGVNINYPSHYISLEASNKLIEDIKSANIQDALMNLLILKRNYDGKYYFPFVNRVIFPIISNKKLVGFVGRDVNNKVPKYLFNRFPKKEFLMFYDEAYNLAFKNKIDYVFVVEGVYDALAFLSRGIPAVAILGINLSIEQINLLNKFGSVRFLMDQDDAGLSAYVDFSKTIISSNRASFNPIFGFHKYTKDIDEVLKEIKVEDFLKSLSYKNMYDFYINYHLSQLQKQFPKNTSVDIFREELIRRFFKYFKMYKENTHAYNLMLRLCERSKYPINFLIKRVDIALAKETTNITNETLKDIDYISPKERKLLKHLAYVLQNEPNNKEEIRLIKEYNFRSKLAKIIVSYLIGEIDSLDDKSYSLLLEISPEKYNLDDLVKEKIDRSSIVAKRLGIRTIEAVEKAEEEEKFEEENNESEYII